MDDDSDSKNGLERLNLQLANGVRCIVQDLDDIRCEYGFTDTTIAVLTPKVETKLRKGYRPFAPLRLHINSLNHNFRLHLTFPIVGYPSERPIAVTVQQMTSIMSAVECINIETQLQQFCDFAVGHETYGLQIIRRFLELTRLTDYASDSMEFTDAPVPGPPPSVSCFVEESFVFACRGCRAVLFDNTCLQSHSDEIIENVTQANGSLLPCSSWFLEAPLPWMRLEAGAGEVSGKICCPSCSCKIGSWNWSGGKCSCSHWVTPAFQFQKSKLDAKPHVEGK